MNKVKSLIKYIFLHKQVRYDETFFRLFLAFEIINIEF